MNLSTKERYLLEDQKNHEQICIQKYADYANMASDQQLKNIFNQNGQKEKEHYNTINQILNGQVPAMNQQAGGGQQQAGGAQMQAGGAQQQTGGAQMQAGGAQQQTGGAQQQAGGGQQQAGGAQMQAQQQQAGSFVQGGMKNQKSDKDLCTDMLMTEKYVSDTYDTAIFEFKDPQIRNILNHIQKEEQQHGEAIFTYMNSKGMYQTQ